MDPKQRILLGVLAASVVLGIVTLAFWPRPDTTQPDPTPSSTASATIDPDAPADPANPSTSPAPTPTPTVGGAVIGGIGPTEDEGYDGPLEDLTAHYAAADAGVLAYATVVPGESVEARSSRLAPFFAAGAEELTIAPRIANPRSFSGVEATVTPTSRAVAALQGETADTYKIIVVFSYHATYVQGGQPLEVFRTGTWNVTMGKAFDGKLLSVIEPSDLD